MNKFWVIVGETYRKNVKSASFIIMLLSPVLLVLIGLVIGFFITNNSGEKEIAILSENLAYRDALIEMKSTYQVNESIDTETKAKEALKKNDISGYFVIQQHQNHLTGELYTTSNAEQMLEAELSQQLSTIQSLMIAKKLSLSAEDLEALTSPAIVTSKTIHFKNGQEEEKDSNSHVMSIIALVVAIFIFMFVIFYSAIIAQEIASEKGTRIMEIILSSTRATTQFYGKLLGVLLMCLTQIVVYVIMGMISYIFVQKVEYAQSILASIPPISISPFFTTINVLFFIFGMLLYSVLAALLGSLVSKTEDVQKSIQPLTFLALIGFYVGNFVGISNPTSMLIKVFSYIPFFSPFTMPFRMASETVSVGGVWISFLLLVVGTFLVTWLSAILYSATVLVYGDGSLWKNFQHSLTIWKNEK